MYNGFWWANLQMLPMSSLHQDLETQVRKALPWVRQEHLPCAWHGPSKGTYWIISFRCLRILVSIGPTRTYKDVPDKQTQDFESILRYSLLFKVFHYVVVTKNSWNPVRLVCLLWFRWQVAMSLSSGQQLAVRLLLPARDTQSHIFCVALKRMAYLHRFAMMCYVMHVASTWKELMRKHKVPTAEAAISAYFAAFIARSDAALLKSQPRRSPEIVQHC